MNESGSLATFVQRWWAVLLCGAVVAALVGFVTAKQITQTFEAETQLLVGPVNTTFDLDASGTLARTYAELGATRPVLIAAIANARARISAKDLKEATAIESNEVTRIVVIRVQDTDRVRAALLANSIANRLVEITNDREGGATSGLERFGGEPEIAALTEEERTTILNAANRVFGPVAGRLSITEAATAPDDPVKPSIPLIVLLAALAGVMLAAFVATTMESRGAAVPAMPSLASLASQARRRATALAGQRRNGTSTAPSVDTVWLQRLPPGEESEADDELADKDVELRTRDG